MENVTLTIPGEILASARIPRSRVEAELRKELAIQLYREGIVTGAGACRLADLGKLEFQHLLGERGVAQQYDEAEYQRDVENLDQWLARD